jgi:hypothetical protein
VNGLLSWGLRVEQWWYWTWTVHIGFASRVTAGAVGPAAAEGLVRAERTLEGSACGWAAGGGQPQEATCSHLPARV